MTQSKLILLAEDNLVNQKVATRLLEKLGHRVETVANGGEAIAALTRTRYDLVLMDCQMPGVDGYEATAEIRRQEGMNRHTMIVAMTAHAMKGDREKCLAAGMDDYLSKPVRRQDLANLLERVFVSSTSLTQNDLHTEPPAPVDMKHLHDVMGDELSEILDLYLTETTKKLEQLTSAIQTNNINEVDSLAHTCAGTSATCGMVAVVPAFRALEQACREGSLEDAPAHLEEAQKQFERICAFLKAELAPETGPRRHQVAANSQTNT